MTLNSNLYLSNSVSYCVKLMTHSIVSVLLDCAHTAINWELKIMYKQISAMMEKKRDLISVLVQKKTHNGKYSVFYNY